MKVAAVFGYGPGLGAALAQKWSQQGFKVALLSRTLEKVEAAAKEIPNSKGVACDVSDMNSIETAVKEIESSMGPIDTVLWNAGSGVWDTWDKIDLDKFELSMRTNCSGLLKATQLAAPGMIERKEGGIYVTGATGEFSQAQPLSTIRLLLNLNYDPLTRYFIFVDSFTSRKAIHGRFRPRQGSPTLVGTILGKGLGT
eukprot:scaffold2448_cov155-Amphora_coffeaeformis.AAC.6